MEAVVIKSVMQGEVGYMLSEIKRIGEMKIKLKPLSKEYVNKNFEQFKNMSSSIPFDNWDISNYLIDLPLKWESSLYVINEKNEFVGFLISTLKEKGMHINRICVKEIYQGKGIGNELIDRLILFAKSRSLNFISLKVHKINTTALEWYKLLNFCIIETRNDYKLMQKGINK